MLLVLLQLIIQVVVFMLAMRTLSSMAVLLPQLVSEEFWVLEESKLTEAMSMRPRQEFPMNTISVMLLVLGMMLM